MKTSTIGMFVLIGSMTFIGCMAGDPGAPADVDLAEEPAPLAAPDSELEHCVMRADATPIGQDTEDPPPSAVSSEPPQCFRTFSEAIRAATGGGVVLPEGATPDQLDEAALRSAPPGRHVIGIEYWDANHKGASYTFWNDVTCTGSSFSVRRLPNRRWNDKISSARAFANCNHSYHYEHDDFKGAVKDCRRSCGSLGALNDHTSSIKWTR